MDWRGSRTRLLIVAVFLALWTLAALGRLAYLQLFRYSDFLARAERQQQRIVEISPRRADIYDRNMQELAMSVSVDSCFAVPSEIGDPEMASRLLARVLGTSPEEIEARLASSKSFAWIARKITADTAVRIQDLNLRGIYFQKEEQRFYPKGNLAAPLLGYVDIDGKGLGGIEYGLDDSIRSKPGRMLILADAHSRWYDDSTDKTPADGSSVALAIDENIQYIAEKELGAAIRETHALAGTVIVEDPSNGEILAMANWPTFNPNAPNESKPEARMNRAVGALYEPGSVFKIVTLSAAIDQGVTRPDEMIDCQMGAIYIAGHRIRDHKPFGMLSVADVLANSSDVGAIKIGLRLGAPKLYDYIRAYGFGSPTGIDLPGENRGLLRRLDDWTPVSVGSISMGQEVGVTPIQMISAMSVIANGGLLVRPQIVLNARGEAGDATADAQPRRVIRETTAAAMRSMLEGVVLHGTGLNARLDGYTAAGKTGTAQKIDPATGRYSATQLIASFVGFAPVNNPAVTILVQLDSPVGLHEGGSVAAPVFKRIAEQVLAYRSVPHDIPLPAKTLRAAGNTPSAAPQTDVADFDPAQLETPAAGTVTPSLEAPRSGASADTAPTMELAEGEGVTLPDLTGKTVREATQICMHLGVNPALAGEGIVEKQDPPAGSTVRRGSTVTVQFGRGVPVAGTTTANSRTGGHRTEIER